MANFQALDATGSILEFDAEGVGTPADPHRNRSVIARIDRPTIFEGFTGTIVTGTSAVQLPSIEGEIFKLFNLSFGFLYLVGIADSSVGANLAVVASRYTIRPRQSTIFELANCDQLLIGASINNAQYTLHTTRFAP